MQSVLQANELLYVTRQPRLVEWNRRTKAYRFLTEPGHTQERSPRKNTFYFSTVTPRVDFTKPTNSVFKECPFSIPLAHIYLDYDVHLLKAIVQNIVLALGEVALAELDRKPPPSTERVTQLRDAFSNFDSECSG